MIEIITIVIIWILLAIIIPLFLFPNFFFRKSRPQKTKEVLEIALKVKETDPEKTLKNTFKYITKKYTGVEERYKLAIYHNLPQIDIKKIINKKFLSCYQQNWIITNILLATKQFRRNKIKREIKIVRGTVIHQYLIVQVNNKKYKVDPFFKILQKLK